MAMSKSDRDYIMLSFALTEGRRALDNLAEVERLAALRVETQPGVEVRENRRVFDQIRLGLQVAANVSRLFWPPRNIARGAHLRSLTGLPETHGLSDRSLRNHIEHLDERLDAWTATSPRPFLTMELVLHDDDAEPEAMRAEVVDATAIVYDAQSRLVHLFGDTFSLPSLRRDLEDVMEKTSQALMTKVRAWK
ncbi:hypothetical protein [Altererythrobacter fulvus]|uniref:hypothetical protein n=1 Tax=Caenibius fulvus TaxID=2126012 RepID=UPI003015CFA6